MRRSAARLCLRCATALLLTLGLASSGATAAAAARVPQGFAGVNLDGPMWPTAPQVNLAGQLDRMVAAGVENIRIEIDWANTQPYAGWSDVPAAQRAEFTSVDGLPLRLGALDELVALCAQRGISLRPDILDAPDWDAAASPKGVPIAARTPRAGGPFGTFLAALVHRYGPRGSLWATRSPRLPIRMWQIWNEPNLIGYWATQPNFEPSYVALLKVAHDAIKHADPGAKVILAGMVNASWKFLAAIYRVRGARSLFDVASVHPYTHLPAGVLTILGNVRSVMDRAGDRGKPIVADEIGWNSSAGKSPNHFGIEVTEAGQAHNVARALSELAAARTRLRLIGFDYYDWAGIEQRGSYEFNFAGLYRLQGSRFVAKPVLGVYRSTVLALERCRAKSRVATRCSRPG